MAKVAMPDSFQDIEAWRAYEAANMPEKGRNGLQALVHNYARERSWRRYHTHISHASDSGFPDCLYLRAGRLVVAELKRVGAKPTEHQRAWLDEFRLVPHAEVYLWTPADWLDGTIAAVLF